MELEEMYVIAGMAALLAVIFVGLISLRQPTTSVPMLHSPKSRAVERMLRLWDGLEEIMIRLVLVFLILTAPPAQAGFKMFGPNGYMNSSETDEERGERRAREDETQQQLWAPKARSQNRMPAPEADADMSGIEWRQSRGAYSGRNSEYTKPFGYRAGVYTLEYAYKGRGNFIVWMHTRKGQKDLVLNNIGSQRGERTVVLKADDEIYFDVLATGNWELTFERKR